METIDLAGYDPSWPTIYQGEADRLTPALARFGLRGIEHIGSTAIANMPAAKPIVDIVAGMSKIRVLPSPSQSLLGSLGYVWGNGGNVDADWWFFIKRSSSGVRIAHLHVVPYLGKFWAEALRFRDALRRDPSLVHVYCALKVELAERFKNDRQRYVDGKDQFITAALATHS